MNLVDNYFNQISGGSVPGLKITATDANDTWPQGYDSPGHNNVFSIGSTGQTTLNWKLITATTIGWALTADDLGHVYPDTTSANVPVSPSGNQKLIMLLPNETSAPGTATGKSGSQIAQTAGTPFNITVLGCDQYWNVINDTLYGISPLEGNPGVQITDTDPYNPSPSLAALANGIGVYSWTIVTAGSQTITVNAISGPTYTGYSEVLSTVNAAPATRLLAILPGENYSQGSATGKTGTPNTVTAGVPFNVTVRGCDVDWNTDINACRPCAVDFDRSLLLDTDRENSYQRFMLYRHDSCDGFNTDYNRDR